MSLAPPATVPPPALISAESLGILVETLDDHGVPLDPQFKGLSFDRSVVGKRSARISWDCFALFIARFEDALGLDIYQTLHDRFRARQEYGPFRHLIRLTVSPHMGFQAMARWFGPHWFPLLEVDLEWTDPNYGCLILRVPEPYRDSPPFFHMTRIGFEVTAQLLSNRDARVELELHPREARYHIHVPPRRTLGGWFRRVRAWLHPDAQVLETLNEQQDELRATLHKLQESENRYRQLVEQSRSGIWRLDLSTEQISFVSPAVKHMLGFEPEEIESMSLDEYIVPEDMPLAEEIITSLSQAAVPGDAMVREIRHLHKDGHIVWCEVHAAAIRDPKGRILTIQGVTHDISARKQVELERERAVTAERERDQAEGANRLKNSILASMSHEIRTPLTSQLGFIELLLRDLKGTRHEKHLQVIDRSGRRLLTLLNNMLDLARLDAENIPTESKMYPVALTVQRVVDLVHLQAEEKGLTLSTDIPDDLLVSSDPRKDEQILLNVIGNAIRYTNEGSITVTGRTIQAGEGYSSWSEVRVVDTGVGISKEFLPYAFEEFRQEREYGEQRERKGGTGLGLAITRRLMNGIGGRIFIESEKEVGTTVILRFPAPQKGAPQPS